ncbi:MAG: arginase family protein [Spirochaetaceae bacterium]|nr:arginase family protein [Spirochaetaceae bacterium]
MSQQPPPALVLLGLPADEKSSYMRGAALAPSRIREALACASSNLCAEDGFDLGADGAYEDAGDLPLGGSFDAAAIEAAVAAALNRGAALARGPAARVLCLGGDHAVTLPILRACARAYARAKAQVHGAQTKALQVLHLDAHPDLYPELDGDLYSHACPFARALEEGLVSRLIQVGIRGMNAAQRAVADRHGVEVLDMAAFARGRRPSITGEFYLSLDLDVLDPAFAPGLSHREPGGLSVREAIELIQSTPGTLIGADLVEYNPTRDIDGMTGMVAAKLLKEIAARLARGGGPWEP